jgi:hypothetical protein
VGFEVLSIKNEIYSSGCPCILLKKTVDSISRVFHAFLYSDLYALEKI